MASRKCHPDALDVLTMRTPSQVAITTPARAPSSGRGRVLHPRPWTFSPPSPRDSSPHTDACAMEDELTRELSPARSSPTGKRSATASRPTSGRQHRRHATAAASGTQRLEEAADDSTPEAPSRGVMRVQAGQGSAESRERTFDRLSAGKGPAPQWRNGVAQTPPSCNSAWLTPGSGRNSSTSRIASSSGMRQRGAAVLDSHKLLGRRPGEESSELGGFRQEDLAKHKHLAMARTALTLDGGNFSEARGHSWQQSSTIKNKQRSHLTDAQRMQEECQLLREEVAHLRAVVAAATQSAGDDVLPSGGGGEPAAELRCLRSAARRQRLLRAQNLQLQRQLFLLQQEMRAQQDLPVLCDGILGGLLRPLEAALQTGPEPQELEDRMLTSKQLKELLVVVSDALARTRAQLRDSATTAAALESNNFDHWPAPTTPAQLQKGAMGRLEHSRSPESCPPDGLLPLADSPELVHAAAEGVAELAPQVAAFAISLRCHILPALSATPGSTAASLQAETSALAELASQVSSLLNQLTAVLPVARAAVVQPSSPALLAQRALAADHATMYGNVRRRPGSPSRETPPTSAKPHHNQPRAAVSSSSSGRLSTARSPPALQQEHRTLPKQAGFSKHAQRDAPTSPASPPEAVAAKLVAYERALERAAAIEHAQAAGCGQLRRMMADVLKKFCAESDRVASGAADAMQRVIVSLDFLDANPCESTLKHLVGTVRVHAEALRAIPQLLTSRSRLSLERAAGAEAKTILEHWDAALKRWDVSRLQDMATSKAAALPSPHPARSAGHRAAGSDVSSQSDCLDPPSRSLSASSQSCGMVEGDGFEVESNSGDGALREYPPHTTKHERTSSPHNSPVHLGRTHGSASHDAPHAVCEGWGESETPEFEFGFSTDTESLNSDAALSMRRDWGSRPESQDLDGFSAAAATGSSAVLPPLYDNALSHEVCASFSMHVSQPAGEGLEAPTLATPFVSPPSAAPRHPSGLTAERRAAGDASGTGKAAAEQASTRVDAAAASAASPSSAPTPDLPSTSQVDRTPQQAVLAAGPSRSGSSAASFDTRPQLRLQQHAVATLAGTQSALSRLTASSVRLHLTDGPSFGMALGTHTLLQTANQDAVDSALREMERSSSSLHYPRAAGATPALERASGADNVLHLDSPVAAMQGIFDGLTRRTPDDMRSAMTSTSNELHGALEERSLSGGSRLWVPPARPRSSPVNPLGLAGLSVLSNTLSLADEASFAVAQALGSSSVPCSLTRRQSARQLSRVKSPGTSVAAQEAGGSGTSAAGRVQPAEFHIGDCLSSSDSPKQAGDAASPPRKAEPSIVMMAKSIHGQKLPPPGEPRNISNGSQTGSYNSSGSISILHLPDAPHRLTAGPVAVTRSVSFSYQVANAYQLAHSRQQGAEDPPKPVPLQERTSSAGSFAFSPTIASQQHAGMAPSKDAMRKQALSQYIAHGIMGQPTDETSPATYADAPRGAPATQPTASVVERSCEATALDVVTPSRLPPAIKTRRRRSNGSSSDDAAQDPSRADPEGARSAETDKAQVHALKYHNEQPSSSASEAEGDETNKHIALQDQIANFLMEEFLAPDSGLPAPAATKNFDHWGPDALPERPKSAPLHRLSFPGAHGIEPESGPAWSPLRPERVNRELEIPAFHGQSPIWEYMDELPGPPDSSDSEAVTDSSSCVHASSSQLRLEALRDNRVAESKMSYKELRAEALMRQRAMQPSPLFKGIGSGEATSGDGTAQAAGGSKDQHVKVTSQGSTASVSRPTLSQVLNLVPTSSEETMQQYAVNPQTIDSEFQELRGLAASQPLSSEGLRPDLAAWFTEDTVDTLNTGAWRSDGANQVAAAFGPAQEGPPPKPHINSSTLNAVRLKYLNKLGSTASSRGSSRYSRSSCASLSRDQTSASSDMIATVNTNIIHSLRAHAPADATAAAPIRLGQRFRKREPAARSSMDEPSSASLVVERLTQQGVPSQSSSGGGSSN